MVSAVSASTLGAHSDEGNDYDSEHGQDEEHSDSVMGRKADVAEGPSEPVALGVAEGLFDLHALGVQGDDVACVTVGQ